uniref:Inversin (inferred by orthology to a human protein) n=1 Tax=Strongyloides venezuelensis TaxID=75913 RepID=A0A0K0G335_STRVS
MYGLFFKHSTNICTSDDIIDKVDTNLRTALFYGVLGRQARTLDVMISNLGFDKMAKDILDRTVLHVAAYCGFVACVHKLIDHGVEINVSDKDTTTSCMFSWQRRCCPSVGKLWFHNK